MPEGSVRCKGRLFNDKQKYSKERFLDALASLESVIPLSGSTIFREISDQWISNLKHITLRLRDALL